MDAFFGPAGTPNPLQSAAGAETALEGVKGRVQVLEMFSVEGGNFVCCGISCAGGDVGVCELLTGPSREGESLFHKPCIGQPQSRQGDDGRQRVQDFFLASTKTSFIYDGLSYEQPQRASFFPALPFPAGLCREILPAQKNRQPA